MPVIDIEKAISETHHENPAIRRKALLSLCPCHVRSHIDQVWKRTLELSNDPESGVRSIVLHHLCDGSPRLLRDDVVATLEKLSNDPDLKIRRRARRALAIFRRTGTIKET